MTATAGPAGGDRLLSVEAALERILGSVAGALPAETVAVGDALGRVLAEPATSVVDLPPWDNSAMDGYAIRAADVVSAGADAPVRLEVLGEVPAGAAPRLAVRPGTALRIATGAPVPAGADAVVPVEETTPLDATGTAGERGRDATGPLPAACLVHLPVAPGWSIRRRGEDVRVGDLLVAPGRLLRPADLAIAAAGGNGRLRVHARPTVAVLSTGDELRPAGSPLGPAQIPDSNRPGLLAQAASAGAQTLDLGIAPDRLDAVLGALRSALGRADAIVVSGGVSVGPFDVVRSAFAELGRVDLWRVALQPGKPFAFGVAPRPAGPAPAGEPGRGGGPVLLFGLPGNPVSVFVTFELFVRPVLDRLAGRLATGASTEPGVLEEPVRKPAGRRTYLRVVARRDANGRPLRDAGGRVRVSLAGGQGSHVLSAMAAAEALAVVPETVDHLEAGAEVQLRWLPGPDPAATLVATTPAGAAHRG